MRRPVVAFLVLSACAQTQLPVTNGRIVTADQFDRTVAGSAFSTGDFSIAFRRDGSFAGRDTAGDFAGRWTFSDALLCTTRTEPAPRPTECQVWTVDGNAFTVIRDAGRGTRTVYVQNVALPPSFAERTAGLR